MVLVPITGSSTSTVETVIPAVIVQRNALQNVHSEAPIQFRQKLAIHLAGDFNVSVLPHIDRLHKYWDYHQVLVRYMHFKTEQINQCLCILPI
jgi:hypothetical protein